MSARIVTTLVDFWRRLAGGGREPRQARAATPETGHETTPEERLRTRATELERRQQDRGKMAEEAAAAARRDADKLAERVRHVGHEYLKRTGALVAATRHRVHHAVLYADAGRGFTLEVGRWPALQATWEANAWHVALRNRRSIVERHTYDSDHALLTEKDKLLEDPIAEAVEALIAGKEPPAGRDQSR